MSGGERQRIGLARAMFKNHEILILDESTNALDKKNEELVFQALLKFRKNKTVIFITHKPIKYKKFDKIFRIENNKIRAVKNS
jgi:ABC-type bacteriocin/lantibiotic exporter with double-glycine peptidase domain